MNRTIWSGRISRGCLVLPLAESTIDLQVRSSCSGLVQVSSQEQRFCNLFWSAIPILVAHWLFSVTLQQWMQGSRWVLFFQAAFYPLATQPAGSCSVPGAGFLQVSISSFLQLDFELLALWVWWFTQVKLHRSFCGCQDHWGRGADCTLRPQ